MMLKSLVGLLALAACVRGVAINNGIVGPPEIGCGPNSIEVNFNTKQPFQGHVYVKGRYDETPACRNDTVGRPTAGLVLPFDGCGTQRRRSLNPKGVFVSNTVVISFHPNFITKIDQAYRVQCFYMEADKTVSQELEVSMLTTAFHTDQVLMPVCRYEIKDQNMQGPVIQFAQVGQQVYHQWICDSETSMIFCMSVYSCFVDDGAGNKVDLIDEDGCAIDKFLLNNIEYSGALEGGVQAHVFKYADKPKLFFNCQIRIAVKDPSETQEDCSDSPIRKQCPEPSGRGGPARKKRDTKMDDYAVLDVNTEVNALDLEDKMTSLPTELAYRPPASRRHLPTSVVEASSSSSDVCMSTTNLFVFLTLAVVAAVVFVTIGSFLMARGKQ